MEQRSSSWYSARKGKITASNVGAILGNNPYRTRDDVMRAMVRDALGAEDEFEDNVAVRWGRDNEDGALLDFRIEKSIDLEKIGFVEFEDWAGVSPDGFTSDGGGIEAKCPYSLRNAEAPVPFKTLDEQPHYRDQVQFSLFVTGRPHWWFFQWAPAGTSIEKVYPCKDWVDTNVPRLRQFHAEFLAELENPDEHLAPRRAIIDTAAAKALVAEWDDVNTQLERLAERKRVLLGDMVSMAGERDVLFAGRKLTLVEREGAISYAKAIKALAPDADLSAWRGKATRYWRLG